MHHHLVDLGWDVFDFSFSTLSDSGRGDDILAEWAEQLVRMGGISKSTKPSPQGDGSPCSRNLCFISIAT